MHILFATTVLPHLQTTGGEIASQAFIDAMRAAGHKVQIFGFARRAMPVPDGSICTKIRAIETADAGFAKYCWLGRSLLTGRPYVCEKFRARRYLDQLRLAARPQKADVLVLDHAQMGWLLPEARHLARSVILIAHNREAMLYAAEAARETRPLQRMMLGRDSRLLAMLESRLAKAVDQIWTLSEAEQAAFGAMGKPARTSLLPLAGRTIAPRRDSAPPSVDIGLLGTWIWDVNGRGLDWFTQEVVPLLPLDVTIRVGGRGSERVNGLRANLIGVGFVADPVDFMRQAHVLAVPTIVGAGIQLKTIEAIASGTPTVGTRLAVRGIGELPGYVAVADTPAAFADALLQMKAPPPGNDVAQSWITGRRQSFEREVAAQLNGLAFSPSAEPIFHVDSEP